MSARKKRHEEHEEHVNHERWLITYADMITLLMVLFIVLFAIGQTDLKKFAQLRDSLNNTLGGKGGSPVFEGGAGPMTGALNIAPKEKLGVQEISASEQAAAAQKELDREAAVATQQHTFQDVQKQIQDQLNTSGLGNQVQFHTEARGLVVTVITDRVLFDVGKADLRPEGTQVLDGMTPALEKLHNPIAIEGHTDNSPISSAIYPTNWELSTARATSVLRYLVSKGLPGGRLSAAGYADQKPIAPNDNDAHRAENRRVEVVILSEITNGPVNSAAPAASTQTAAASTTATTTKSTKG
jgi:chemotaxis protein MotB